MAKTNADIGQAFACMQAARTTHWRTELVNGVCIGVSYSTPVCAHFDGIVLRTVHTYSMTTSGKHLSTIYRAGGTWLPATEQTLRDLQSGYTTWEDAVQSGRDILKATAERLQTVPVSVSREGSFNGGKVLKTADGKAWLILTPDHAQGNYRTRRDAAIAARAFAPPVSWQDVTNADTKVQA